MRAHLTPDKEDDPGYAVAREASDWAALTDDELFRLHRKVERDNMWNLQGRIENELATRLIHALAAPRKSSDAAAARLTSVTWAVVLLTVVIAGLTVALFFKG